MWPFFSPLLSFGANACVCVCELARRRACVYLCALDGDVRECCLFVERFISIHKLCINFVGLLNATLILLRRTNTLDVPYAHTHTHARSFPFRYTHMCVCVSIFNCKPVIEHLFMLRSLLSRRHSVAPVRLSRNACLFRLIKIQ